MVYDKIMALCKERKVPVYQLEKSCGIGNGTIGRWSESNPRVDRLKLVADFFGVTIDELISDAPAKEYQKSRREKRTRSEEEA